MANGSNDKGIRELIGSVTSDAKKLAQSQSELAKLEIRSTGKDAGAAGGMFAGAAAVGGMGGIFLLITIAYVLVALGLPEWAGFGIVTLVLILVAGILAAVGSSKAKSAKGAMELTKLEWERTQKALSGKPQETLPAVRSDSSVSTRQQK